jgi:ATP-dependent Lon protease
LNEYIPFKFEQKMEVNSSFMDDEKEPEPIFFSNINQSNAEPEDNAEDESTESESEFEDNAEDNAADESNESEPEDNAEDESNEDNPEDKPKPKNKRKRVKNNDEQLQSIIAQMMQDLESDEDLSTQILKYLQELNWKNNLSDEDAKNLQPMYDKICEEISIMPKISDILKLSMPYEEKCDIVEKILILYNAQPNTFEFLQLKRHLNKLVEKYRNFSISDLDYEKYKRIEDSLTISEQKYKPLKYKILDADMSDVNKAYLYQRYKYFSTLESSNSEYNKLKQWIDLALSLPNQMKIMKISASDTSYKINKYLWTVKNMLDKEIFGLDMVKEKILFLLNNRITNNKSKGLSFALCGLPGTGKTSIIQCLSKAIDLPFFQINLGGAKDVSFLSGHGYTYEGAVPGVMVQALTTLKYTNGIIYFDEFDKISNTLHGTEISRMLLHITDFSQNDKFHDRYLSSGIDIDLSNIWFIYSLNDKALLDKTLSDRIPIIEVPGYNKKEKFHIVQHYIIPKILDNIGLRAKDIIFTDDALKYLIDIADMSDNPVSGSELGSGVRTAKHLLENLLMKINLLKTVNGYKNNPKYKLNLSYEIKNFKLPLTITKQTVDDLKIYTDYRENLSYRHMYI